MALDRIEVDLERDEESPSRARAAMAKLQPTPAALVVASELVTHAVVHGAPPISLFVTGDQDSWCIEVYNQHPGLPSPAEDALARRVLDRLSTTWGLRPSLTGACLWAVVARDARSPHTLG
jgi:hypothetical protein